MQTANQVTKHNKTMRNEIVNGELETDNQAGLGGNWLWKCVLAGSKIYYRQENINFQADYVKGHITDSSFPQWKK